ncbi:unnamed protein product [Trichobilharzia szidati]|nr:unnamed protein product [Trichobilharzia szidati]
MTIYFTESVNTHRICRTNPFKVCIYLIFYFMFSWISAVPFHRMHSEITVSLPDTYKSQINRNYNQLEKSNKLLHNMNNNYNTFDTQNSDLLNQSSASSIDTVKKNDVFNRKSTEALHFQSGSYLFNNNPLLTNSHGNYLTELNYYPNVWFQQRKHLQTSKYRPNLWTSLNVENCYEVKPAPDLLSIEEIDQYEKNLLEMNDRTRFSRQIRRKYARQSRRLFRLRNQRIQRRKSSNQLTDHKSEKRKIRSLLEDDTVNKESKISDIILTNNNSEERSLLNKHLKSNTVAAITVHKIAIRPSVLVLKHGNVQARIHYVMQLHRELSEQYRLIIEVRMNPSFPPLYIGVIQNVCDYWQANVPQSKCSLKRPRFYQKNTMCFCNMPPGIYRQRVKLNLNNILDELELPRFLVNFLLTDKKLDVHITIKLEMENKDLVGCMKVKLPLQFISA